MKVIKDPAFLSSWNQLMNKLNGLLTVLYGTTTNKFDAREAINQIRQDLDALEELVNRNEV